MTLYEIDKNIEMAIDALLDSVDEETGEVNEEMANAVDELKVARKEKLEGIGCYIKNLFAEVEAIKEEADNLRKRAKVMENRAERLREYVANSLLASHETKFEGVRVAYSFRRSESVEVLDLEKVPSEYLKTKTEVSADKVAIKKVLKEGNTIDGCALVIKQNLLVK